MLLCLRSLVLVPLLLLSTSEKTGNLKNRTCVLLAVFLPLVLFCVTAYAQSDGDIRLMGTTTSTADGTIKGRLEVYHNSEWRGVCDDYFTDDEAIVACKQLKSQSDSDYTHPELGKALTEVTGPSDDFWLDDLICVGTETKLSMCPRNGNINPGDSNYWGNENCRKSEYAGAVCYQSVTKPKAPKNLVATPAGEDTIALEWDAPYFILQKIGEDVRNRMYSIVTGYKIEVSEDGGDNWTDLEDDTENTDTTYNHTGLSPGDTRHYRVSAINSADTSDPSNIASATVGGSVANKAPEFSGTTTTRSVDENTAAGANIGAPVTATDPEGSTPITYSLGGTDAASFGIITSSGQLQTKAALDYETKDSYSVTVTAQDPGGATSEIAVTINVNNVEELGTLTLKPTSYPLVGTMLTAEVTDPDDSVTIVRGEWEKKPANGSWEAISGVGTNSYTPVDSDLNHLLKVKVYYKDGHGSNEDMLQAVSNSVGVACPQNNTAPAFSESSPTTRSVDENRPLGSNVGTPVTATDSDSGHQIKLAYSLGGQDVSSFSIDDSTGQIKTKAVFDYESGDSPYTVTVNVADPCGETAVPITVTISVNDVEESVSPPINTIPPPQLRNPPQTPSSSPPPVKVPLAPQNLVAMPGDTEVMLEWMAPYDNGSAIKHYEYEMDGGQWTSTGGTSTSYNVTELTNGETYRFRVRAVNSVDSGPPSRQASATPATVPGPPRNLTATPGDQRVTLIWERPADNGGLPITGYQYSQKEEDGSFGRWVPMDDSGPREANETSYTVTGLENGTVYSFRVRAVNAVGPGDPSAEATAEPSTAEFRRARHASLRILPTFGRTMLRNSVDALTWRLDSVLSGSYERTGMFRLMDQHAVLHEVIGNDIWDDPDEWEALSLEEMLYGSSFIIEAGGMLRKPKQHPKEAPKKQVKKYAEEAPGEHIKEDTEEPSPDGNMWIEEEEKPAVIERRGSMGFWGKADYNNLSVTSDEWFSWDGRIVSGYMGVDRWLNEEVLTGLSVSLTEGDFDYTDTTPGVGGRGDYRIRMVSVSPYVSWFLSQDVYLWSAIGYGRGQIDIDDEGASRVATSDLSYKSVAAGGSGRVFDVGDTTFSLKSEAFKVWMDVEGDDYLIDEMSLGVHQLRLSMEGSYEYRFASGTWFNPLVEVALRHDGGDGETGTGIELGGGFLYENPSLGLSISGRGRWLATHSSEDFSQWGLGGAVVFDKGADKRGVLFSVAPEWGDTSSGVDSLWERGVEGLSSEGAGDNDMHLDAEFGYGLAALGGDGLLTPYSGLRLGGDGRQHYRLGSRLDLGRSASLSLETERRQSDTAKPEHGVILRGEVNF